MTSERSEGVFPNSELTRPQGLAGVENRDRLSPSWEEILASDPDHEKHLETPEGRFQAVLNIVKNGAMVLEVMAMDRSWQDFHDVYSEVNKVCGFSVNTRADKTANHLIQTISTVGAAARSDINDTDWQLTPFGQALKPALIYTWQKFLAQEINPAKALTSTSKVKKDKDGNLLASAPYSRAKILLFLASSGQMKEVELVNQGSVTQHSVKEHLKNLKNGGLINFESVDAVDSYIHFL